MTPDRLYVIESRDKRDGLEAEWHLDFCVGQELRRDIFSDCIEDQVISFIMNGKDDARRLAIAFAKDTLNLEIRVRSCLVLALPTKDLKIATYGVAADKDDDDER